MDVNQVECVASVVSNKEANDVPVCSQLLECCGRKRVGIEGGSWRYIGFKDAPCGVEKNRKSEAYEDAEDIFEDIHLVLEKFNSHLVVG